MAYIEIENREKTRHSYFPSDLENGNTLIALAGQLEFVNPLLLSSEHNAS